MKYNKLKCLYYQFDQKDCSDILLKFSSVSKTFRRPLIKLLRQTADLL